MEGVEEGGKGGAEGEDDGVREGGGLECLEVFVEEEAVDGLGGEAAEGEEEVGGSS